jgi:hypothetical protein
MKTLMLTLSAALSSAGVSAADHSGRYVLHGEEGTIVLELKQAADGALTGSVTGLGRPVEVAGQAVAGGIQGQFRSSEGTSVFEGRIVGVTLQMAVADVNAFGQTDPATLQRFVLKREGAAASAPTAPATPAARASAVGPGPAREISDPDLGYMFSIPSGWQAQRRPGALVLGSGSIQGVVIVVPHEHGTLEALRAEATQGLTDDGLSLALSEPAASFGERAISAEFEGSAQGQPARAYAVALLSPFGGGVTIVAIAASQAFAAAHHEAVAALAHSFRFTKPAAPPEAAQWQQKFAGRCVAYRSSSSSSGSTFSDRTSFYLGTDGSFGSSSSSMATFDSSGGFGSSHSASGSESGTWRIAGSAGAPSLELRYGDGRVIVYQLSSDERARTYLDGDRWLVVSFLECQEN